jgi:hypothetical protein
MTEKTAKSRASRAAEQKRAAAERARRYRERRAETGKPSARAVDAAWSEASAYWLAREGVRTPLVPIRLMQTARLILEREGYVPAEAADAIADRLQSRPLHKHSDAFPSLCPGPIEFLRETRAGPWTTPADVIARLLAR